MAFVEFERGHEILFGQVQYSLADVVLVDNLRRKAVHIALYERAKRYVAAVHVNHSAP